MIHSFSCKNFYSFKDLTRVDFTVGKQAPKGNAFFKDKSETRLSKIETVIGPNASGKTNLLRALPFIKWLIVDSFNLDPKSSILVQTFKFDKDKDKPAELSAEFEIDGTIYNYYFSLTPERIYNEKLLYKTKTKIKTTYKTAFSREWDSDKNVYRFSDKSFNFPKGFEENMRKNTSLIGSAIRLNHKPSQLIANFWNHVETNVIEAGWIGDYMLTNANMHFIETLNFFNENEALKREAEKLLSSFDLGLDSFEIKKEKKDDGNIYISAKGTHIFDGVKESLDMRYESSGTRQLLVLLRTMLSVLDKGGVAVLDEIDVNLHPEMVIALFNLFVQPETNPNNAQLIFSTHSHLVLSNLSKYQITLVEKDKNGVSNSWRLDEMSNIRSGENYYLKYITGAYGAFPNVRI